MSTHAFALQGLEPRRLFASTANFINVSYDAGISADLVTSADFNKDGRRDVAVASTYDGKIRILYGQDDESLGEADSANEVSVTSPVSLVARDFTGDRRMDLAVLSSDGTVSVFAGSKNGSFWTKQTLSYRGASHLVSGDFNADGRHDLAVASSSGLKNSVSVLFNKSGKLRAGPKLAGGFGKVSSLQCADVNADGRGDLISVDTNDVMHVFRARGRELFTAATNTTIGDVDGLLVMDLDDDGRADMVAGEYDNSQITVRLGRGNGRFDKSASLDVSDYYGGALTAGDVDANGTPDLIVSNYGSVGVEVFSNDGFGGFTQMPGITSADGAMYIYDPVRVVDLDGNGHVDLIRGGYGINVYYNVA